MRVLLFLSFSTSHKVAVLKGILQELILRTIKFVGEIEVIAGLCKKRRERTRIVELKLCCVSLLVKL